jgi:hypothetical protein
LPLVQKNGESLPFVLKNIVSNYACFDGIAHELLPFSSPKLPICCFKYQEAGIKLKYKLAIAANNSFKSQTA